MSGRPGDAQVPADVGDPERSLVPPSIDTSLSALSADPAEEPVTGASASATSGDLPSITVDPSPRSRRGSHELGSAVDDDRLTSDHPGASEARKTADPHTSAEVILLGMDWLATVLLTASGRAESRGIPVSTEPGMMALTVTPRRRQLAGQGARHADQAPST